MKRMMTVAAAVTMAFASNALAQTLGRSASGAGELGRLSPTGLTGTLPLTLAPQAIMNFSPLSEGSLRIAPAPMLAVPSAQSIAPQRPSVPFAPSSLKTVVAAPIGQIVAPDVAGQLTGMAGRAAPEDGGGALAGRLAQLVDGSSSRAELDDSANAVFAPSSGRSWSMQRYGGAKTVALAAAVPALAATTKAHAAVAVPALATASMAPVAAAAGITGAAYLVIRRIRANMTLSSRGKDLKEGPASDVLAALNSSERNLRIQAAEAAAARVDANSFAVPLIRTATDAGADMETRLAAVAALRKIEPSSPELVRIAKTDPSGPVRYAAIEATLSLGGAGALANVKTELAAEIAEARRTGAWGRAPLTAAVLNVLAMSDLGRPAARRLLTDAGLGAASGGVLGETFVRLEKSDAWGVINGIGQSAATVAVMTSETFVLPFLAFWAVVGLFYGIYKAGAWLFTAKDLGATYVPEDDAVFDFGAERLVEASASLARKAEMIERKTERRGWFSRS